MADMRRELSAFFNDRYPKNARQISQAVELPNGWVLAESFERRRDNRGGVYTSYYATMVKSRVLLGEEGAHTANHYESEYPSHPRAQSRIQSWFETFYNEGVE